MAAVRQVLFLQGGGAGAHDDWDAKLVASLGAHLGDGYEVLFPLMPDEGDPSFARWSAAIDAELAAAPDGVIVVAHSLGAPILLQLLSREPGSRRLGGIVLVSAPFVGPGGWPGDEFTLADDLGARLPQGVPVHVFHGLDDETAPPQHAELYRRAIPQADVHLLPGRDHQLNDDLREVARAVDADRRREAGG